MSPTLTGLQVNTPLDLSSSLGRIHQPFTVGARVGVFNKKKVPILGTIRWMGTDILTRTLGSNHIGIETVSLYYNQWL